MQLDPPAFPARWGIAFGEDEAGLWQAFEVAGVRQIMRWIEPGNFMMGSPDGEADRQENETLRRVTISQGYWLAETACSQAIWQAVMGGNPSHFKASPDLPVDSVSWDNCQEFIAKLNEEISCDLILRLPTEAEWEYACRAGTTTPFSFGEQISTDQTNFDGNYPYAGGEKGEYRETTVPVLSFNANPWGLFQMHGNVFEWCSDWYDNYSAEAVIDPKGPTEGRDRVLRGGGWVSDAQLLRSASRYDCAHDYRNRLTSFRLAGGLSSGEADR